MTTLTPVTSKRETTGWRIRSARMALGLNQSEFGASVGLEQHTISNLELDRRPPTTDELREISAFTGRTVAWFVGEPETMRRRSIREQMAEWLEEVPKEIPIYDQEAHAGFGGAVIDYTWIDTEANVGKTLAGVYIRGRCLEPEISAGDVVIVDRDMTAQNGDVIVAFYEEVGLRIGRVSFATREHQLQNGDGIFRLKMEQIQGVVIEVRKKLGRFKSR